MTPKANDEVREDNKAGSDAKNDGGRPSSALSLWGQIVKDPASMSFFLLVFLMGVAAAAGENFAYVRIQEVGGTARDMGFSRLTCSMVSAPAFFFSGPLLQSMNVKSNGATFSVVDKVMILCFLCQSVRYIIFYWMTSPYWGHLAEALRGFSFAAFWTTSTVHANSIAPTRGRTTMVRGTMPTSSCASLSVMKLWLTNISIFLPFCS